MSYKCEILADSIGPQGNRLTTFKVTYPRIIHAEMCRHRILSRNTASSRAIPFDKMVKDVLENPFIPIAWQKEVLYICRKIRQCIFTKQRIYSTIKFI